MQYFTPQLWLGFNNPGRSKAALKTWGRRFKSYQDNLKKILPSLNPQARRFFRDALVLHDGTLMRMEVGDRVSDTQLRATRDIGNRREAAVRLFVLSGRVKQHRYTLEYKNIKRIELEFPGKLELFPVGAEPNFGDWGYDELTSPEKGLLRHEILFASGASIVIEFRDFSFSRKPVRKRKTR
jgi:hypothetical protein